MEQTQRRLRFVMLFVILSLALASLTACSQEPQVTLDKAFSSSDAKFSLRYPTGWSIIESSDMSATLVNTENWDSTVVDDKYCYAIIGVAEWTADQVAEQKAADPTFGAAVQGDLPTPDELVSLIVKGNAPDNAVTQTRMRINGNMAATLDQPMSLAGGQQMQIVAIDLENGSYVLAASATIEETMPMCQSTTLAVVKSVKWSPGT